MTPEDRVVTYVSPERVELAVGWYGGQASMLYAVASTGALSLGNVMPYGCETLEDWRSTLADRLLSEVREAARMAADASPGDGLEDADALAEWADDLEVWQAAHQDCTWCGSEQPDGITVGDDRGVADPVCATCLPHLEVPDEVPVLPPRAVRVPRQVYRWPHPVPLTTEGGR